LKRAFISLVLVFLILLFTVAIIVPVKAHRSDVKFRGTVVREPTTALDAHRIHYVRVEEVLMDPIGYLQIGRTEEVWVRLYGKNLPFLDDAHSGDRVEVFGWVIEHYIHVEEPYHYLRKIGAPRLPDLTFQKVGFDKPEPFQTGDVIRFGAVIVNQGDGDAYNFRVEVYLDNWLYDSGTISLGARKTTTLWCDNPWKATEGTHTLTWIADTTNIVTESNENNNQMSRTFTVGPPPFDFSISVEPSSLTIRQGESATYRVTVTSLSESTQRVSLSLSGYHETMSYSFNPSSGNPTFTSTLTITTSTSTPVGDYTLTITGGDGGKTRTTGITLHVEGPSLTLDLEVDKTEAKALTKVTTKVAVRNRSRGVMRDLVVQLLGRYDLIVFGPPLSTKTEERKLFEWPKFDLSSGQEQILVLEFLATQPGLLKLQAVAIGYGASNVVSLTTMVDIERTDDGKPLILFPNDVLSHKIVKTQPFELMQEQGKSIGLLGVNFGMLRVSVEGGESFFGLLKNTYRIEVYRNGEVVATLEDGRSIDVLGPEIVREVTSAQYLIFIRTNKVALFAGTNIKVVIET
jgi:hypothetical protein